MKIFYSVMSFLTAFFFTLNCACFAQENSPKIISDSQTLANLKESYTKTSKGQDSSEQTKKNNNTNIKKQNKNIFAFLKKTSKTFLKHILSATIDYAVASIIGNLIELKIKNKNKNDLNDNLWLLRDPCCQC